MRRIKSEKIREIIAQLCVQANTILRPDFLNNLRYAYKKENKPLARGALKAIIENASFAKKEKMATCQDTGLPWVLVELGQDLKIIGDLKSAINQGIKLGYQRGSFRKSIVDNPLSRNKIDYGPAVIHIDITKGNKIKLIVLLL